MGIDKPAVRVVPAGCGTPAELVAAEFVTTGVHRRSDDLATGLWDVRHGHLRQPAHRHRPLEIVIANP